MGKFYFVVLSETHRIRVRLETRKRKVENLVVQLEVLEEDWRPVVRYNFAHGFPHRGVLLRNGRTLKTNLGETNLNKVATQAIEDVKKNWRKYARRYGFDEQQEKKRE